VSEAVLVNRAKGMILCGAIFKGTTPDESDEERRELERMVAEAAAGKSKHTQLRQIAKDRKAGADGTKESTTPPAAATAEKKGE
jgi:hypothetical protein